MIILFLSLCAATSTSSISGPAVPPTTVTYGDDAGNFGTYPLPLHVLFPLHSDEVELVDKSHTQLLADIGSELSHPCLQPYPVDPLSPDDTTIVTPIRPNFSASTLKASRTDALTAYSTYSTVHKHVRTYDYDDYDNSDSSDNRNHVNTTHTCSNNNDNDNDKTEKYYST